MIAADTLKERVRERERENFCGNLKLLRERGREPTGSYNTKCSAFKLYRQRFA